MDLQQYLPLLYLYLHHSRYVPRYVGSSLDSGLIREADATKAVAQIGIHVPWAQDDWPVQGSPLTNYDLSVRPVQACSKRSK